MTKFNKNVRFVILTAVIHVMIFVTGGIILFQLQKGDDTLSEETAEIQFQKEPETITIQTTSVLKTLDIQGRVQAENRIELFSEVQGKVVAGIKPFREGIRFDKGEVLFKIDDREIRLQLYSARSGFQTLAASLLPDIKLDHPIHLSQYERWYESLHPEESLAPIPDFDHPALQRFLTSKGIYDRYYYIKSIEDRLNKFTVRAPFSGVLSTVRVEPGQNVGPQFHAGTFVDPDSFLMTVSVRQTNLKFIKIGDTANLTDLQRSGTWTARVVRINPTVDVRSQTVEIYLEIIGYNIREGMYLDGSMVISVPEEIAEIPKTSLLRNSYVYTVSGSIISQKPVTVMDVGHQTVRVTGLENESRIIRDASQAMSGQIIGEGHK